jgi:hypothetical protein
MTDKSKQPELPLFDEAPAAQVDGLKFDGRVQQPSTISIAGDGKSGRPVTQPTEIQTPLPFDRPEESPPKAPQWGDENEHGQVFNGIQWCDPEEPDPDAPWWKK